MHQNHQIHVELNCKCGSLVVVYQVQPAFFFLIMKIFEHAERKENNKLTLTHHRPASTGTTLRLDLDPHPLLYILDYFEDQTLY